jgi:hypothetical protein
MVVYCSTSNKQETPMAKIKNTGHQPRGFIQADGSHVTVAPGEEAEVNLTEADHKHLTKMIEGHDEPKPFEISGGHEAEPKKGGKKEGEVEMPAQSTEPPPQGTATTQTTAQTVTPMTDKERREREAEGRKAAETKEHATTHKK